MFSPAQTLSRRQVAVLVTTFVFSFSSLWILFGGSGGEYGFHVAPRPLPVIEVEPTLQELPILPSATASSTTVSQAPKTTLEEEPAATQGPSLSLPEIDSLEAPGEPDFCTDRFSGKFLYDLRDQTTQHCLPSSPASLACFHSFTHPSGKPDSLCIGQGAVLDLETRKFNMDCQLQKPTVGFGGYDYLSLNSIQKYWYETGPGHTLSSDISFGESPSPSPSSPETSTTPEDETPFIILIKREPMMNLWHNLMEIWATFMSIDVLRISPQPDTADAPYFNQQVDITNTQVVFLDDEPDGPFIELWKLVSDKKPIRLHELVEGHLNTLAPNATVKATHPYNVIFPMAGAGNPMWQIDWIERNCYDSSLLKNYAKSILELLQLPPSPSRDTGDEFVLTFVDRHGTRKLWDQRALLEAVETQFPDIIVQVVDFGTLSLRDQIETVRSTDLLVGVHGAGLTHEMFLEMGGRSGVVEIQPEGLGYRGFENMAKMLGHYYWKKYTEAVTFEEGERRFREKEEAKEREKEVVEETNGPYHHHLSDEASPRLRRDDGEGPDWHFMDVWMEKDEFVELITEAVTSMRNGRLY